MHWTSQTHKNGGWVAFLFFSLPLSVADPVELPHCSIVVRTAVPIVVVSVATQAGAVVATGLAAWPLASCWHCFEACCCPVALGVVVMVLLQGVIRRTSVAGHGPTPARGQTVTVHCTGIITATGAKFWR